MPYVILTFTGDYPVEAQPFWDSVFSKLESAIWVARSQHHVMVTYRPEGDKLYTVVVDKDDDEVVHWIAYKGREISNKVEATKLADSLIGE
jgi:hypothetical protein